jgi:hypothetical protein
MTDEDTVRAEIERVLDQLKPQLVDMVFKEVMSRIHGQDSVSDPENPPGDPTNPPGGPTKSQELILAERQLMTLQNNIDETRQQLALAIDEMKRQTADAIVRAAKEVRVAVHNEIVEKINETFVPHVNRMAQIMVYKMESGEDVLRDYRNAVHEHYSGDKKSITSGQDDTHITPHITKVFGENY